MNKVYLMRAGAPDKLLLEGSSNYEFVKYDHCNLRNLSMDELIEIQKNGDYVLASDEGDILYANKMYEEGLTDQSFIMLPHVKGTNKVIDYFKFVSKSSDVYKNLEKETGIKYLWFTEYTPDEFQEYMKNGRVLSNCAIRTTTGSGSRGTYIASDLAIKLKFNNYHETATLNDVQYLIDFARNESKCGYDCKIMVQDLIPVDLLKVNIDFIIKDGRLLGYKWDIPETGSNFTVWNNLTVLHNEHTEKYMGLISDYLINKVGIDNAILNIEMFQTADFSEIYMIEINWRYGNSTFESKAFGVDFIDQYLKSEDFRMKTAKLTRTWKAVITDDVPGYVNRANF